MTTIPKREKLEGWKETAILSPYIGHIPSSGGRTFRSRGETQWSPSAAAAGQFRYSAAPRSQLMSASKSSPSNGNDLFCSKRFCADLAAAARDRKGQDGTFALRYTVRKLV